MIRIAFATLATFFMLLTSPLSAAIDWVGDGKIVMVENGWLGEGLVFKHSGPGISGCPADIREFAIDKNHLGYKELVSIALTAYTSGVDVQLVVDKGVCLMGDRTKVLAIRLLK